MTWSGRRVQRLLATVLATYGDVCVYAGTVRCRYPSHPQLLLDRTDPAYTTLGPSSEHLLPRSRGGSDSLDNLRPCHRGCNSARGNRSTSSTTRVEDGRAFFRQ